MLNIILDTNLFRTDLKGLENYSFSNLFEKLNLYIKTAKIADAKMCMVETALKEFVKQIADDYQTNVVDAYTKAYEIIKDSLPVLKMYFRDKYDFMEEYYYGIVARLNNDNIEIIETLPFNQIGGMKMNDVLTKTIKDIAPFDKTHNRNLNETINSRAKDNNEHDFLFITCNVKDFKQNIDVSKNYQMGFIEENDSKDKLIIIMKILKDHGIHIDDETFYQEFLFSYKVRNDIKRFLEINIIESQLYDNVPEIKKSDESHYDLNYEITEDGNIDIKFIVVDGEDEHNAGIVYDLNKNGFPMVAKYVYYTNNNNEDIYYDEF